MSEPETNGNIPTSDVAGSRSRRIDRRRLLGGAATIMLPSVAFGHRAIFDSGTIFGSNRDSGVTGNGIPGSDRISAILVRAAPGHRESTAAIHRLPSHRWRVADDVAVRVEWEFQSDELSPGFPDHGELPRPARLDRRSHDGPATLAGPNLALHPRFAGAHDRAEDRRHVARRFAIHCRRRRFLACTPIETTSTAPSATSSRTWTRSRHEVTIPSSSGSPDPTAISFRTPPAS